MRPELEHLTVAEPITGWRGWRLIRGDSGDLRLDSAVMALEEWTPQLPAAAHCLNEGHERAPDPEGKCGLYAFKSFATLRSLWGATTVVGTVALWGRVVEHQFGYRAEFAYPQRLRLVCVECLRRGSATLEECTHVVEAKGEDVPRLSHELVALCASHVGRVEAKGSPLPAREVQTRLLSTYSLDTLPALNLPRVRVPGRWAKVSKMSRQIRTAAGWTLKIVGGAIGALGFLVWGLFDGCATAVDKSGHQINTGPLVVRGMVLFAIGLAMFGSGRVLHKQPFLPWADQS